MTAIRKSRACPREPIGLSAPDAAAFIGVSEGHFLTAVKRGLMPAPFELMGRKVWHADEIEASLKRLPRKYVAMQDEDVPEDWGNAAA